MKNILILGSILIAGVVILAVSFDKNNNLEIDNLLVKDKVDDSKKDLERNRIDDDKLDGYSISEIEENIKIDLQNNINLGINMENGLPLPVIKVDRVKVLNKTTSPRIELYVSGDDIPSEYDIEGVQTFSDALFTKIRNYIVDNYDKTSLKSFSERLFVNGEIFEYKGDKSGVALGMTRIKIPDYKYKNIGDNIYDWVLEWRYIVVPETKEVLRFSYKDILGNNFKSISIKDGVAKLVINKSPSWLWRENPSEAAVVKNIEMNALQYDTVKRLEVYLNDNLINLCDYSQANPEESGCDKEKKYWVVDRK